MASRPDPDTDPLSSEELEQDRARSPQSDGPDELYGDDDDMVGDGVHDLEDREQDVVETALTRLPPG